MVVIACRHGTNRRNVGVSIYSLIAPAFRTRVSVLSYGDTILKNCATNEHVFAAQVCCIPNWIYVEFVCQ